MENTSLISKLLDLIYPDALYCISCGKLIDRSRTYNLCNECMREMKWAVGRTCDKCGKPISDNNPNETCYSCREHAHVFDKGFTVCEYGEHERSIIFALKYSGRTDIAGRIAEMMHDRLAMLRREGKAPVYDLVVPVPIYGAKKRKRGFNQAALIAKSLAEMEGARYEESLIMRIRDTRAMKGLSPIERRRNVSGAFEINRNLIPGRLQDLNILTVDDIYTTGATIDEIASILKQAGAAYVFVGSFAAGADVIKSNNNEENTAEEYEI